MKKNSTVYVIVFMLAISAVFGVAVSIVHYSTLDMLEKNRKLHMNRTICNAFMLEVKDRRPESYEEAVDGNIRKGKLVSDQRTIEYFERAGGGGAGVGFVFISAGFWDRIAGIIAMSPDLTRIINIQFLEHKETPGLGARIEEPWFTDQFRGLEISWESPVEKRIVIGPGAERGAANRVDAITGASQTSMALNRSLNNELELFRGLLEKYRKDREIK
jgi:Na+-transporting NADH:ubiquinone oxidoreductase subunit C